MFTLHLTIKLALNTMLDYFSEEKSTQKNILKNDTILKEVYTWSLQMFSSWNRPVEALVVYSDSNVTLIRGWKNRYTSLKPCTFLFFYYFRMQGQIKTSNALFQHLTNLKKRHKSVIMLWLLWQHSHSHPVLFSAIECSWLPSVLSHSLIPTCVFHFVFVPAHLNTDSQNDIKNKSNLYSLTCKWTFCYSSCNLEMFPSPYPSNYSSFFIY